MIYDNFSVYNNISYLEPKMIFPSMDEPLDISDWAIGVSESGIPIIKEKELPFSSNDIDYIPTRTVPKEYKIPDIKRNLGENELTAMLFFLNKGLSSILAAGIVGNLMGESNLNHQAVNPYSKAYGIALWLGKRKENLFSKYGRNPSFYDLLEFIWEELNTTEKKAFNNLLKTTNINDAIEVVMSQFERPSKLEMDKSRYRRLNYGKSLLV